MAVLTLIGVLILALRGCDDGGVTHEPENPPANLAAAPPLSDQSPGGLVDLYRGSDGDPSDPADSVHIGDLDHVAIGPNGEGLPDDAWWAGPIEGLKAYLPGRLPAPEGGSDPATRAVVFYVTPRQAKIMDRGFYPENVALSIQTEHAGSFRLAQIEENGLPIGPVAEIAGVGDVFFDPAGIEAVMIPERDSRERVMIYVNGIPIKGVAKLLRRGG